MEQEIEELQALAATSPPFEPKSLKNPNNKWLVRSGLQKAIRRGQIDRALAMGQYVLATDQDYAWKALATIIIEDVGFGDLDLVSYSTLTTLKTLREQMHSPLLYGAMIKRACEAPKSRSCCELSLGFEKAAEREGTEEAGIMASISGMNNPDLVARMLCGAELKLAYGAATVLRKKLRGQGEEVLYPALLAIREAMYAVDHPDKEMIARAAMLSFERTVDSMNLALFPVLHWMQEKVVAVEDVYEFDEKATWPEEIEIKSVSSAAFDMHTSQGKKAIKALWLALMDIYPDTFGVLDEDTCVRALGSLVFIHEGGMVDRRLVSKSLLDLKTYQDENFAVGYGCPADNLEEMSQLVRGNIPLLNEKRKWAAGKS